MAQIVSSRRLTGRYARWLHLAQLRKTQDSELLQLKTHSEQKLIY